MKAIHSARVFAGLLALAAFPAWHSAQAQGSSCEGIAKDVTAAIHKDPSKLLMIVEDALVINESCACEIIQAAIIASQADPATVNQIVQTGISVAPRMSGVITDCAAAVAPHAAVGAQVTRTDDSAKNPYEAKNPGKNPILPEPPMAPVVQERLMAPIRGIYLIQAPASGFVPCDPKFRKCINVPTSPCLCVVKP